MTYDARVYRSPPASSPFVLTAVDGTVTAFARTSGQIAWKFQLPIGAANTRYLTRIVADERRVVIAAARAYDDGSFFSLPDTTGELFCLDYASGRVVWHQRLPQVATVRWISATLLVDGAEIFLVHASHIAAFALETGQFLWQQALVEAHTSPNVHPSPLPVALAVPGNAVQADSTA